VWAEGKTVLFFVAAITAGLTAFYMSRLLFLAFFGDKRWSEGTHPHESPSVMIVPMSVLAVLSILGGLLNLPEGIRGALKLNHFLEPVVGAVHHGGEGIGITVVLWALSAAGVIGAWWIYGVDLERRAAVRRRLGPLNSIVRHKFFVDEIYSVLIVAPLRVAASFCAGVFDRRVIDGAVNGAATVVSRAAGSWRHVQSGFVRNYAVAVIGGAAVVVAYFVLRAG
jgi:NADH-quinone oxidoreductase subunit L